MSFEVYTYSPSEVVLDISGYQITGFDKITVSRNSPPFSMVKGIRGQNTRVRNKDTSCTVTVDLLQTAVANDVLSDAISLDLLTNSVRLSLLLTDALGNARISSTDCYIETYPEMTFSRDIEYRRWTLTCLSTDTFMVGGNASFGNNAFTDAIGGAASAVSDAASGAADAVGGFFSG